MVAPAHLPSLPGAPSGLGLRIGHHWYGTTLQLEYVKEVMEWAGKNLTLLMNQTFAPSTSSVHTTEQVCALPLCLCLSYASAVPRS